ncbi:protein kinase domain-containing protein [Nocardia stercoris]|uniref:Protein kinase n=1 Tax=Nocardia stercoris TaxID=2483361 RepID=A0A3M2KSY1_9NOCA|nr:protein kinase [Nocardia stercoris]RMI28777.1 protein kinase [Nocardia stercoris]
MVDGDPLETQRDVGGIDLSAELSAAGFDDADEIGRGGFGAVYRCTQIAADRTVAVKVLTGESAENRERFVREQHAMGRLTGHPNIADMLEIGQTTSGRPYLVMPYYARGSLSDRIRRDGPLPLADVLHLGVRVAGALETAHWMGVLHRDVKPANILLTDYGEPALTDFGIAHFAGGYETTSGAITGSPAFTAPEVLGGKPQSAAADVYGLGATLFCALTGHAAFERRSGEQLVAQFVRITTHPIPDARESGIPEDVCAAVEAAMARDPHDRPSAAGVGEQLRQLQRDYGFPVDEMALPPELDLPQGSDIASKDAVPHHIRRPRGDDLQAGSGNLPLELTSFVDRRTPQSEVKNLVSGSRLVTVTGIGGVGKSRLALRVAHTMRRKFPNGAWLVELSTARDAESLPTVVAAAFGVRDHGVGSPLQTLVELLAPCELLLVLDNCEYVIAAVVQLGESLLRACPNLHLLATSREPLGIGGEAVYPLSPLETSDPGGLPLPTMARLDAVTLFAERAAAAVPGFTVTDENRLLIARVCARLDGLPLAIELAAARLRTMSVEQILAHLDDRFALLTLGSRGAPQRQQTMHCCMDWSYDLCTPDEQRLWSRLAVFAGGFELDAALRVSAVGLTESKLHDAVSGLVDKSILVRTEVAGSVRFRMLETVREFGQEKAENAGEYPALRRRHRQWCEDLVRDADAAWIGPAQSTWVERLEREVPNLWKALEFSLTESEDGALRIATSLYLFWLLRGRIGEGRRWYERVLDHPVGGRSVDRAKALYAASVMALVQGDMVAAEAEATELASLAEDATDPVVTGLLAHTRANYAFAGGASDPYQTVTDLEDALRNYERGGDTGMQLGARISLGWAYALQGDPSRALACLEQALAVTESAGETIYRSWLQWSKGFAAWRYGETDSATCALETGIRLAHSAVDPLVVSGCLETLAWIAAEARNARRAATLMGAADALGHLAGGSPVIFPEVRTYHDECEQRSRQLLGTREFDAARNAGAALGLDAAVAQELGARPRTGSPPGDRSPTGLTRRERQVADLVADGLTNKAIADRLVVSLRTAQGHVEHILTKLGFTSRAQIAAWVVAHSHTDA